MLLSSLSVAGSLLASFAAHGTVAHGTVALSSGAQEGVPQATPAPQTVHPVVTAMAKGASAPLHLRGSITVTQPEREDQVEGFFFPGPGGDGDLFGRSYEGDVEIVRTEKGELIVVSTKTAPGFVLYDDGSTRLVEILHGESKMRLGNVETELMQLLNFEGLVAVARKAEKKADEKNALPGAALHRFTFCLPTTHLQPKRSREHVLMMPGNKILDVGATVDIDPTDGSILSMQFDVLRNDPFSMFAAPDVVFEEFEIGDGEEIVVEGELDDVVAPVAIELRGAINDIDEDAEGATTTYEFTRAPDSKMSRRMTRALERMRQNIDEIAQR